MLDETQKGNLVLKDDLNNVDKIAATNQTIAARDAATNAVFAVIELVLEGVKTVPDAYSVTRNGADADDAIEEFLEPFEDCIEKLRRR